MLFKYYPSYESCGGSIPEFSATLYDNSFFEFIGNDEEFGTVYDFIQSLKGKVAISIEKSTGDKFIMKFFKYLGYINEDIQEFVKEKGDYYVIVKNFKNVNFSGFPLRYEKSFAVYDISTKRKILEFKGDYDILVFQIGEYKGKKALLVAYTSRNALNLINNLSYEDFSKFTGNLVIVSENGVFPLSIGKKFKVEYHLPSKLEFYFKKYQYLFMLLAIFILTILFTYMWRKLS